VTLQAAIPIPPSAYNSDELAGFICICYQWRMARLSDLVQIVADATGETTASVTVIARSLREAGLIATGGRGRSAARMTSRDLASLLLAVSSLGDNTKAGETVSFVSQFFLETEVVADDGNFCFSLNDDYCQALGVKAEQSLHGCLATQIDRYSINPESPNPAPPQPDLSPFSFNGSTLPRSIEIGLGQGEDGWEASIKMQLCGGDDFTLLFSPDGQSRWDQIKVPGRRWFIRLGPEVTHRAVLCLRDLPAGLDAASASQQP
jgi:hypothetical protein